MKPRRLQLGSWVIRIRIEYVIPTRIQITERPKARQLSYAVSRNEPAHWEDATKVCIVFQFVRAGCEESTRGCRAGLARLADLHQTYIGLLERGDRSPNVDTAKAIAAALRTTLATIIEEAERDFNRSEKQKTVKK
jgi:transcriptional regulator with XRE-family HTH domain